MEAFIIAILIALISSIFNKVKETPPNKPVRQKPIQSESSSPVSTQPEQQEIERERSARREPREFKEPLREAASSIQTRFEEKKKEAASVSLEQRERYSRRLEAHQTRAQNIRKRGSSLSLDFKKEEDIVKGFIFSEVFGPPRSKKRHHQK
ncbi:hypothetical protein QTG56_12560 [Rossellomorea sp. AcN35-11]|nr:hypothetical protein [Rossellomorea aquimaris]WJV27988.1 hypothetical protein QTG56_12560 [Rossellomorea sp. AcN35-11]